MEKRNITVKKVIMGSQEDIDSDAGFVDGTPQERWDAFWELMSVAAWFSQGQGEHNFNKPLRRDVARKLYAEY